MSQFFQAGDRVEVRGVRSAAAPWESATILNPTYRPADGIVQGYRVEVADGSHAAISVWNVRRPDRRGPDRRKGNARRIWNLGVIHVDECREAESDRRVADRRAPPPPIRFLVYVGVDGDFRLITLRGTTETVEYGGPCEEGWSRTVESYSVGEEGTVVRTVVHDDQDCDGRHTRTYVSECAPCMLAAIPAYVGAENGIAEYSSDIMMPDWQPVDSHQRDRTAEAAGY